MNPLKEIAVFALKDKFLKSNNDEFAEQMKKAIGECKKLEQLSNEMKEIVELRMTNGQRDPEE